MPRKNEGIPAKTIPSAIMINAAEGRPAVISRLWSRPSS
jgi:hypothetical protein